MTRLDRKEYRRTILLMSGGGMAAPSYPETCRTVAEPLDWGSIDTALCHLAQSGLVGETWETPLATLLNRYRGDNELPQRDQSNITKSWLAVGRG